VKTCPFCEVVADGGGHAVVYSDEVLVAFLCEPPATWGHTLVVPRAHRDDIWAVEPRELTAATELARLLGHAMRDDLAATGVNIRQNSGSKAGQYVFHFHLHVVPRYEDHTMLPGCVLGMPPWEPPAVGDAERDRVASVLPNGLGGDSEPLQ
jgi:histidine triad (HIT) family protein